MHRILVVEDEEGIRKNIERLLTLEGYEVATAPNGQHGLVIARSMLPDIVITDINMPGMDGFAMLDAIRHHPELDRCIVIMLTAADERDSMRRGMRLGADDYLTKPFRREELLDAIASQLKKVARFNREKEHAIAKATALTEEKTRELFREQFAGGSFPVSGFTGYSGEGAHSGFGISHPALDSSTLTLQATVMFADIRNFTTMAERLSAAELAALLGRYFELACRPVVAFGGSHLKMLGDGLLALFEEDHQHNANSAEKMSHAQRALAAALGLQEAVGSFRQWVEEQYGQRGLPSFNVGIGLHSGEVTLSRLGGADSPEVTALGDSVNIASRLQATGKELGWPVVASMDTAQLAGPGLQRGRQELVHLRGREKPVAACEVLALSSVPSLQQTHTPAGYDPISLQNATTKNSQMTARAAKEALKESLWSLQSGSFESMQQSFRGYQIVRKLGEGGMSDVFLAYSAAQKCEVVLKVLRTSLSNDAEMLRRFIQEYAVLANLTHHHVSRIYDQGFTDDYAYIAMEYLSGGTLKQEIRARNTPGNSFHGLPSQVHGRVIDLLRQIVSALHAIHKLGLVYRDLKPDNLMFRSEGGELVLVDFGIVKNIGDHGGGLMPDHMVSTEHGQVIGTPYYVSPEQATGQEVTHRSDFYSLGVMLYEMLTGERPYRGDSLNELLARHLHADIPKLPSEHRIFQPLLDSLMAKQSVDRPADAMGIWRGLDMLAEKTGNLPKTRLE
jgi:class 3 adenylate cyclase/DNA-binding NarL/FixJ family response regulator